MLAESCALSSTRTGKKASSEEQRARMGAAEFVDGSFNEGLRDVAQEGV